MKISYFDDTDTLYIEFRDAEIAASQDLDDDTVLDIDTSGNVIAITMEHASVRADIQSLTLSGLAA